MSERHWRLFAEDILECIEKIDNYVRNTCFEDFETDGRTIDAVVRNLEIIGEASKYIPNEVRDKHEYIDWKGIVGLRNRIIHEYFGVDLKIIWRIVKKDVPILKKQIRQVLKEDNH